MNRDDVLPRRYLVTCIFKCESAEILRNSIELGRKLIDPDENICRKMRYYPDGIEKIVIKTFRLGDFFDKIELAEEPPDSLSFRIVFYPKQGVTSYWKDLLMSVVRTISDENDGVSFKLA